MFSNTSSAFPSEDILVMVEELHKLLFMELLLEDTQRNQPDTFFNFSRMPLLMLRLRVWTLKSALLAMLLLTELSKAEEEPSELMVELVHTFHQTATSSSSLLKKLKMLRRVLRTNLRLD